MRALLALLFCSCGSSSFESAPPPPTPGPMPTASIVYLVGDDLDPFDPYVVPEGMVLVVTQARCACDGGVTVLARSPMGDELLIQGASNRKPEEPFVPGVPVPGGWTVEAFGLAGQPTALAQVLGYLDA